MKICLITNLYPPIMRGGAERLAQLMAEQLAEAGHTVIVISTKPKSGLTIEDKNKIKIYRFRPMNLFYYLDDHKHSFFVRLIWRFFDVFNLQSKAVVDGILKKEKPDLVITHNLVGIGLLIPLTIKKQKIRHIHVIHDVQLAIPSGLLLVGNENSFLSAGLLTKMYSCLCQTIFANVSVVVSPSNWLLNFYKEKGFFKNAKSVLIRNPFTLSGQKITAKIAKTNSYLFLGQLEKHKGILWLIDIWKKNKIEDTLYIVGDGTIDLKNYPSEKIVYLGKKEPNEMTAIFAKVDFLIFPSLCYENAPMVIPQTLQNATPVICADIGGAAELINGRTGIRFTPNNANDFLDKLNFAKNMSPDDYRKISADCCSAAETLNIAQYAKQLNELIKPLS